MKTMDKRELREEEKAAIEQRRALMESMLAGEEEQFHTAAEKLSLLQVMFDKREILKEQGFDPSCMGVMLGDALCQVLGLTWVAVDDENGSEPAVCFPGTMIFSFPLSAVEKRFKQEMDVNVFYFFVGMAETMGKMIRSEDYKKE